MTIPPSPRHCYDDRLWPRLRCGFHSGFPWCCVLYQSLVHVPFMIRRDPKGRVIGVRWPQPTGHGYVLCPFHRAFPRHVDARPCDCLGQWKTQHLKTCAPCRERKAWEDAHLRRSFTLDDGTPVDVYGPG